MEGNASAFGNNGVIRRRAQNNEALIAPLKRGVGGIEEELPSITIGILLYISSRAESLALTREGCSMWMKCPQSVSSVYSAKSG